MTFREDLQTIPSSSNPNPNIAPPHLMFAALDAGGARPTLPIINARGTWTYISASLELPEVRQAKQEAAQ